MKKITRSIGLQSKQSQVMGWSLVTYLERLQNFFLDRGAVMQVELTSKHYRRFSLPKGGMEIACLVRTRIPATLKNTKLAEKYLELVRERYTEPNNEKILGCFVANIVRENLLYGKKIKEKKKSS